MRSLQQDSVTLASQRNDYPRDVLNFAKALAPETMLFVYVIMQIFNQMVKKGQHLYESICVQVVKEISNDPIIRCNCNPGIAKGFVQLNQILEVTWKDANIRGRLEELKTLLDNNKMSHYNLSEFQKSAAPRMRVVILNDKPKDDIVKELEEHISYLLKIGALNLQTALRIDRIFQRSSAKISSYHNPMFDESYHRWLTIDPHRLLSFNLAELKKWFSEDDTNILRDLAVGLGKHIQFRSSSMRENKTGSEGALSILEEKEEDESKWTLWKDNKQDKFAKRSERTKGPDLHVFSEAHINQVVKIFVITLAELAKRERVADSIIEGSEFESNKSIEKSEEISQELLEKWLDLKHRTSPIWKILVAYLRSSGSVDMDESVKNIILNKMDEITVDSQAVTKVQGQKIKNEAAPSGLEHSEERKNENMAIPSSHNKLQMKNPEDILPLDNKVEVSEDIPRANERLESTGEIRSNKMITEEEKIPIEYIPNTDKIHLKSEIGRRSEITRYKSRNNKTAATLIPLISQIPIHPKLRASIKYHSPQNLRAAHETRLSTESKLCSYYISHEGNTIKRKLNGKWLQAKLCLYHSQTDQIIPFYLEENQFSTLGIWNNAAYLYFDTILARRFAPDLKEHFEHCLLYSDLREAFDESGTTKGIIAFAPILKNHNQLSNRAIIADEEGIYLIGGSKVAHASTKVPLNYSNTCIFYSLQKLEDNMKLRRTQKYEGNEDQEQGDVVDSLELKRDDLIIYQTATKLFVTRRTNWNPFKGRAEPQIAIEVFNKRDSYWETFIFKFNDPEFTNIVSYRISRFGAEGDHEKILLIANAHNQKFLKYMLSFDDVDGDEIQIKNHQRIQVDDKADSEETGLTLFYNFYFYQDPE